MKTTEAFLKKMEEDTFRTAFEAAETAEDKATVLAEAGLDLSVDEAEGAMGALDEDALDAVAGGGGGVIRYPPE